MKVYLSWNDPVDRKLAVARQKVSTLVELLNLLMVVDLFVGVVNENIILDNKNIIFKSETFPKLTAIYTNLTCLNRPIDFNPGMMIL